MLMPWKFFELKYKCLPLSTSASYSIFIVEKFFYRSSPCQSFSSNNRVLDRFQMNHHSFCDTTCVYCINVIYHISHSERISKDFMSRNKKLSYWTNLSYKWIPAIAFRNGETILQCVHKWLEMDWYDQHWRAYVLYAGVESG